MKSEVRNWLTKWRLLGSSNRIPYDMLCTIPAEVWTFGERAVFVAAVGDEGREFGIFPLAVQGLAEEPIYMARLLDPWDQEYKKLAEGTLAEARQAVRNMGGYAKRVRRRQAGKTRAKYRRRRGGKALGWLTKTANYWIK